MKKTWLLLAGIILLLIAAVVVVNQQNTPQTAANNQTANSTPVHQHATASPSAGAKVVPAYFETAPSRASLGPTLAPEQFSGPTRDAYRAAREIPVTIAQMPCYCHCDRGMGHKSLYSCFQDDHAAQCATCVNEALLALKLEKEQKLTAPEIRERIIAQYGN
jgi:hypothetical protein